MSNTNKCAAVVQLGWLTNIYEGDDFQEIFDKIERVQDFGCLILQAQFMGTRNDAKEGERMEDWVGCARRGNCDMHHFDDMNFKLSIADIKCLSWAQGEDECEALRAKFKNICN